MSFLSDEALERLRGAARAPEIPGARYRLTRELGRGGMGIVWAAEDLDLEREVAVKVVRDELSSSTADRLAGEARVLARLEHPGIVPVHDVGRLPDGRLFYVMKLVQGAPLSQRGPREPTREGRLRLFARLCEPVAFAHARGVVHRDLKPENVMVGEYGEVLVLDWGVAKLLAGEPASEPEGARGPRPLASPAATPGTAEGTVIGTPAYMAPEQLAAESADFRTDVYALGAILYFLLAGQPPFGRDGRERLAVGGAQIRPEPLRRRDRSIPRPLAAIVEKAMASDPASRYATAAELSAEIARFASGLPVSAYRENPLERARRLIDRNRTAVYLVIAYLAMRMLLLALSAR